jgi:hypothetical protein
LRGRWEKFHEPPTPLHPARPYASLILTSPKWASLFEEYDAGSTGFPLEFRHPLFDLRLASFLLSIPPVPWCIKKRLLREAMRGTLPDSVRLRPKSPLGGDFNRALLRKAASQWIDTFPATEELARYVVRDDLPRIVGENESEGLRIKRSPLNLNCWLRTSFRRDLPGASDVEYLTTEAAKRRRAGPQGVPQP